MTTKATERPAALALAKLLSRFSAEVTTRDEDSIKFAEKSLPKGVEVFVASLPKDPHDKLIATAVRLRKAGLEPVPHIVARNIASRAEFDSLLSHLAGEAGVRRALILGGDRDKPLGDYDASLQLIQTGLFAKHGFTHAFIAAYPETHPRIDEVTLESARTAKIQALREQGMSATLVSQFGFDSKPIVSFVEKLRARGVMLPFRVGVAGPTEYAKLVKYALICGVGPSLRALKERQGLAKNMLGGETPEKLLVDVALAQDANPALNIEGVHFFTFGALGGSYSWIQQHTG
jgi:methylenetetrahydrofolate reductase (NADPH)